MSRADLSQVPHPLANPHSTGTTPLGARWPHWVQWALLSMVLACFAAAVIMLYLERWRRGSFALGSGMLLLAALRWVLSDEILGVLSVRSRRFDSAFSAIIGGLMVALALSVDALGS
ncbi:DUF3017 domain-containing protein [Corynebacterium ulceribovis]|uniref:DUF3017 domain-containing protein n=1 Tax=Corynebacterium ulceribovis TaxID=487732 RepID=UPI00037E73B3|nr:DUF3017 domain-containing protein [Corynebacterium ulceribovis]